VRAAGFERDVEGCADGVVSTVKRVANGLDLGMPLACATMPASTDYLAFFDQHGADHWVGRSPAETASGKTKGGAHEEDIGVLSVLQRGSAHKKTTTLQTARRRTVSRRMAANRPAARRRR